METVLDKFGRIVIQKRLRDDLGLKPRPGLEIVSSAEEVLLKPIREERNVVNDRVLVYKGSATGDLLEAVTHHSEERSRIFARRLMR